MADRPVFQAYRRVGAGVTPENPYPNVASGTAAVMAVDPNWRPPYASGKGPSPRPRMADSQLGLPRYLEAVRAVESSGGINRIGRSSSARGAYQFMPKTAERYRVDPNDPKAEERGMLEMTADNMAALRANNFAPTHANLYALHLAGPTGGLKILKADDGAPITTVFSDEKIKANGLSRDMTVGDLKRWFARNWVMDAAPAGVRSADPLPPAGARPNADQGWLPTTLELLFPPIR